MNETRDTKKQTPILLINNIIMTIIPNSFLPLLASGNPIKLDYSAANLAS